MNYKILSCGCTSTTLGVTNGAEYQNSRYGFGKRVCNKVTNGYRCTVCLKVLSDPK